MSGETSTLQQLLSAHPDRTLVVEYDEEYTTPRLLAAARAIRENHTELASACVALQLDSALQTIIHLIALDGFASRILLLPPELAGNTLESITRSTDTTFIIDCDGPRSLTSPRAADSHTGDTEWLFTTSGTSGLPKVFAHSLKSLCASVKQSRPVDHSFRWGLAYQAHRFAGMQVILQSLISGMVLITTASSDASKQSQQFVTHSVNALSATPSQWRNFLMLGQICDCDLRQITLGGEIADQAVLSNLRKHFPEARIAHIYASTEAGVGFSVKDGLAGFPADWLNREAAVRMKISDRNTLQLKGPGLSRSESLQPRLSEDGYLDTHDCVKLQNNRVYFLGRDSGIINVGGNKVHPEEIENLVLSIPQIHQARVSAKNSPVIGQLVSLEVQTDSLSKDQQKLLKADILSLCKLELQKHKIPALIKFVDSISVADSGKLERKQFG